VPKKKKTPAVRSIYRVGDWVTIFHMLATYKVYITGEHIRDGKLWLYGYSKGGVAFNFNADVIIGRVSRTASFPLGQPIGVNRERSGK
jgi:hypothetical protein